LNRLKSLEEILKDMQKIISDAKQDQQGGSRRRRRRSYRKGTRRNRFKKRN
jgi:hypothetical protein